MRPNTSRATSTTGHRMPQRILRRRPQQLASTIAIAGLLGLAARWALLHEPGQADRQATPASPPGAQATQPPAAQAVERSGLPTIAAQALPPEARKTLTLIERGGPFPYQRDGIV